MYRYPVKNESSSRSWCTNLSYISILASYLKQLDNLISSLEKENIQILICLYETPCWASSSSKCGQGKYRPENYNNYADAMIFLLERYPNRIYAWEIWNEPNLM
jgi:beta-glucosidase/6-phospho-beta-glucosidase/beta-galactosidase